MSTLHVPMFTLLPTLLAWFSESRSLSMPYSWAGRDGIQSLIPRDGSIGRYEKNYCIGIIGVQEEVFFLINQLLLKIIKYTPQVFLILPMLCGIANICTTKCCWKGLFQMLVFLFSFGEKGETTFLKCWKTYNSTGVLQKEQKKDCWQCSRCCCQHSWSIFTLQISLLWSGAIFSPQPTGES